MFCSNCGTKLQEDSKFCNRCGASVSPVEPVAQTEIVEWEKPGRSPVAMSAETEIAAAYEIGTPMSAVAVSGVPVARRRIGLFVWLLPTVSLIVAAVLIGAVYLYQMNINRQVDRLLQEGEKLALEGKLAEGKAVIEDAIEKRPDHRILLADRALLTDAISLQSRLSGTDGQLKNKKYEDALKEVDKLKSELAARSGPVYEKLAASAANMEERIVVAQVNAGAAVKKTVEELVPLLNNVKAYKGEDAQKSMKQIKQKIVDISYEEASAQLKEKQFAEAMSTIEEALKYDEANQKLIALKTEVEKQKKTFEDAENSRIQQAIEAAAQEDTKNRTQAVKLISINAYTDADGYFNVEGTVKNTATRSISDVVIYIDILDADKNIVDQATVYVTPNELDTGETGTFYDYYYNLGSMDTVSVTRTEWHLN